MYLIEKGQELNRIETPKRINHRTVRMIIKIQRLDSLCSIKFVIKQHSVVTITPKVRYRIRLKPFK